MTSETLRAALALADAGFPVFPIVQGTKRPLPGSHGRTDATLDPVQIRAWFEWTQHGIAVSTGGELLVIDLDVRGDGRDGVESMRQLMAEHGGVTETTMVRTGGGGWHLWFRKPVDVCCPSRPLKGVLGVDVRGEGGSAICPPSVHASGVSYKWARPPTGIAPAAEWLLHLARRKPRPRLAPVSVPAGAGGRYGAAVLRDEASRVRLAPEGTRNHTLNAAAFRVGQLVPRGAVDAEAAIGVLTSAAVYAGLPLREARATARRGVESGESHPRGAIGR